MSSKPVSEPVGIGIVFLVVLIVSGWWVYNKAFNKYSEELINVTKNILFETVIYPDVKIQETHSDKIGVMDCWLVTSNKGYVAKWDYCKVENYSIVICTANNDYLSCKKASNPLTPLTPVK